MNIKWKLILPCASVAALYCMSGIAITNVKKTAVTQKGHSAKAENLINVSWGDQILAGTGDAKLDSPEKIERALSTWKKSSDGQTILWRASSEEIDRFYEKRITAPYIREYYQKVADIQKQFDPFKAAREATHRNGQKELLYLTVFDHGAPASVLYGGHIPFPWQDKYTIEHPEMQAMDRKGNYQYGVLELAYPQARKLVIDRMVSFVKESGADGVYVDPRTHSLPATRGDQYGFSKPVVDAYQRRYGINILTDPRFDAFSPNFNVHDPAVEKWRKLRGEYFVEFFRELRAALPGKTIIAGIPRGRYFGAPYGNMYLDWESLVKKHLVDGLVIGVANMRWLYPELKTPHSQLGYLSDEDDSFNIPSIEDSVNSVYGPLTKTNHVKLYVNKHVYGPDEWEEMNQLKDLNGFMIDAPGGGSGRTVILDNPALNFPEETGTIEAFVRPTKYPDSTAVRIISKYGNSDNSRRGWEWIWNKDKTLTFRVNQENGIDVTAQTKSVIPINAWTYVATVYDGKNGEMRLYLNGKLDTIQKIPPLRPHENPKQPLYIGQYGGAPIGLYSGCIDELRISDIARSITKTPDQPFHVDPETVALFHFDAVEKNYFHDATGNLTARLLAPSGSSPLRNSLPGFGKALAVTSSEMK